MSLSIERTDVPFAYFFFICYTFNIKVYSDKKDTDDSFYYQRHSILINFSLNVLIKISGITLTSAFPENTDFLTKDVTVFYKPKTE